MVPIGSANDHDDDDELGTCLEAHDDEAAVTCEDKDQELAAREEEQCPEKELTCEELAARDEDDVYVDDVLDDPESFVGQEVTLEGEVDHIYGNTVFAMEDDQDFVGDDELLILSVMPTSQTRSATSGDRPEITPVVELLTLVDGEYDEGKLVRATGTVRMFDCAQLEQTYGPIDWGEADIDDYAGEPVLVIGEKQFAAWMASPEPVEQQAIVILPEPLPEPIPAPEVTEPLPAPEPAIEEPVAQPEPEPAELPSTASPLPLFGLGGLLSLLVGMGVRSFRQ
jgi:hypothetical protein